MAWLAAVSSLTAADPLFNRGPVLLFNEENDLFVNTDRHYTQGIKVAYLHEDGHLPLGMSSINGWIPPWGFTLLSARSGYSVGQNMYTPADLATRERQPDDRPYAGWLYAGWLLHRSGMTSTRHIPVQETWELELGVMGSPSLARQAQGWVHQIRGFDLAQGWMNQLRDEPAFRLKMERSYRLTLFGDADGFRGEFIPWGGASVGTLEDTVRTGGILRMGIGVPNDFGIRTIDGLSTTGGGTTRGGRSSWGVYGFAGSEGRVVGRNALLDGNLYRESLNVNKRYLVGDIMAGFVVVIHHLELGYTHVFRTPEFEAQTQANQFGSIYGKFRF